MSATYDPFLAASSEAGDDLVLADLSDRFFARVVDNIAGAATLVPGVAAVAVVGAADGRVDSGATMAIVIAGLLLMIALAIGLVALQAVWLTTRGQSVGKYVVGIHIVKLDGSPADFVSAVVLRTWVPAAVLGAANQMCLGWLVILGDIAPAFGPERRCVHDLIAGTKVVAGMPAHREG